MQYTSTMVLEYLRDEHRLTEGMDLTEYLEGVKSRVASCYGTILNIIDHNVTVGQLQSLGVITLPAELQSLGK